LGKLERLACALQAVLLSFLHAAVARQIAGVAELLGQSAGRFLLAGSFAGQAEHLLQGPGDALTDGAALAGEATALDRNEDIEPIAHLGKVEGTKNRGAILLLGEVVVESAAVDHERAVPLAHAHARHRGFPPACTQIELLLCSLCFRHRRLPVRISVYTLRAAGLAEDGSARY